MKATVQTQKNMTKELDRIAEDIRLAAEALGWSVEKCSNQNDDILHGYRIIKTELSRGEDLPTRNLFDVCSEVMNSYGQAISLSELTSGSTWCDADWLDESENG